MRAKIIRETGGKFARFEPGEIVIAERINGDEFRIEREEWKGSKVALVNCCYGVPAADLEILP